MFEPPRCPAPSCRAHSDPQAPGIPKPFFRRKGSFAPRCRTGPVRRFQCRVCGRGFSEQTFSPDYRDRKPHLNRALVAKLAPGMSLRRLAQEIGLTKNNLVKKMRKIARHQLQ